MDAVFNTVFSGDQTMIPSSIKIYEVPSDMAVDDSGDRHNEDDQYIDPSDPTQQATYYNKITAGTPDTAFKNYLLAHVTYDENGKPNGFAVDQSSDGLFNIDGNTDYASHAYFIQVDTVMNDPNKVPGDGTTITTHTSQTLNGTGITLDNTESWTGAVTGNGGGQNQTEAAHVRFYDDTDKKFIDDTPTLDATGVDTTPISFSNFNTAYGNIDSSKYQFVDITSGTQTADAAHEGTEISTDASNPNFGNYDSDPSVDQNFVVHFVHKTESVADQTATVTEKVTYQYENGPHAGSSTVQAATDGDNSSAQTTETEQNQQQQQDDQSEQAGSSQSQAVDQSAAQSADDQSNGQTTDQQNQPAVQSEEASSTEAKELTSDTYQVNNVSASDTDKTNDASSHEDLNVNLGQTQYKSLDPILSNDVDLTYQNKNIGKITQNGSSGYRITFNSNLHDFGTPVNVNLDLQWANATDKAGANSALVYQATSDKDEDGQDLTTTIPNDVKIGDSTYSSDLTAQLVQQ